MDIKLYETTFSLVSSQSITEIKEFAPLKVIIDPFNSLPTKNQTQNDFLSKISKIVYDWGDGEVETVKLIPSNFSDSPVLNYDTVFEKETGDPRRVKKEHVYSLYSELKKVIILNVKMYMFGIKEPIQYIAQILLEAPRLDGTKTGFFKNMHLIDAKIYGTDNKILYIFEGKEPSWVFPVLVDWRIKQTDSTIIEDEKFDSSYEPLVMLDLNFDNNQEDIENIENIENIN